MSEMQACIPGSAVTIRVLEPRDVNAVGCWVPEKQGKCYGGHSQQLRGMANSVSGTLLGLV